jgi:Ca2+-binding EF-hand superfamily protein
MSLLSRLIPVQIFFVAWLLAIAGSPDVKAEGQHDMLLLLPDGMVHLRLMVVDGDKSLAEKRKEFLQRLVSALDVDQDGQLSRAETSKHPLFVSGRRFDDNPFLQSLKTRKPYTEKEIEMAVERAAGLLVSYRQENVVAEQDLSVFRVLDSDESGLIDAAEMRLAASRLAARDSDMDQCVTFDEFLSTAPQAMGMVTLNALDQEAPGAINSEVLRDAREPTMPARLVRKYDTDRDAHLTPAEMGWTIERLERLDSDSDGRLNMQELARLSKAEPDAVFSVNLDLNRASVTSGLRFMGYSGDVNKKGPVANDSSSKSAFQIKHKNVSLQVGYRHRDPLEESRQNALAAFNAIDADSNGYLDKDEVVEHQRFARYLFDAMDRDNDARVFSKEMLDYVRDYTEPASTTCQVTLFDTGNGFFQLLDENGDGRISIRELRTSESRLRAQASNEGNINPSKMNKSYRIEIQRGGVSLFGRVSRASTEMPIAALKEPSGPIWFQRMDRNGDGDLTWDEFLGPREAFHQIDSDGDGLINQPEAESYKK